ncbi:hypothetical protein [Vitreimonas sp.]|uniref:hypothetical protein n=1 Tax=Vitreimonas sp. TaxID=3069702 RepID=UPI002ED9F703
MSERVAQMSGKKNKGALARAQAANVHALETLLCLLRVCQNATSFLDAVDEQTRADMVTHLNLVELDALRLLADESDGRLV